MEKIHIITQDSAGRTITLTGLTYTAITKDNIIGVINETQGEPLYTPLDLGSITNVSYSSGTLTITLASTVAEIAAGDKLLIKFYFDDDYARQMNVGTSSDTASETGSTLFALLKWVKDKVVSIYNAIVDSTNGLAAIKTAASAAQTAAESLTALDSDITAGKTAIATAIAGKGVQSLPTDTLLQMATQVGQIAQAPIYIEGGELYGKQLFGSTTKPNFWNLYKVMEDLLDRGDLLQYKGILLAEYYKGYTSISLDLAGAGGGYVTSDGAYYTEDIVHTWNDDDDGKGNRWVAYLFANESHPVTFTNTGTSPRSIHIGRHVGVITCNVNTRISNIVVTDGNLLDGFVSGNFNHNWNKDVILRNIGTVSGLLFYTPSVNLLYLEANQITASGSSTYANIGPGVGSAIIKANNITVTGSDNSVIKANGSLVSCIIYCPYIRCTARNSGVIRSESQNANLRSVTVYTEDMSGFPVYSNNQLWSNDFPNLNKIVLFYITNDKTKVVNLRSYDLTTAITPVKDIELQQGWNKPLYASNYTNLTEANMYAHILQRLKQDEPLCGSGVIIELGTSNMNRLTSEDSEALLQSLRSTYGYTIR